MDHINKNTINNENKKYQNHWGSKISITVSEHVKLIFSKKGGVKYFYQLDRYCLSSSHKLYKVKYTKLLKKILSIYRPMTSNRFR